MAYEIKRMKASQAEELERLEKACFSKPWTAEMLREEIGEGGFFIGACEGEELIGYAGMRTIAGEGHIMNLCVAPGKRRSGCGGALLDALIAEAAQQGLSFLTLEVRVGNEGAVALYKSRRFIEMGIRPGYYADPEEDALIMTRYPTEALHIFEFGEEG